MKKRIGLLAAALLLLAPSCQKNKSTQPVDPFEDYIARYQSISLHNTVAMDPFYVAHRLNLYLNNGKTEALRQELFHEATVTTDDNNKYVIHFEPKTAPENDYLRSGRVVVYTRGKSLSEPGTIWEVDVDANYPYFMNMGDLGVVNLKMESSDYLIEATTENAWRVRAEGLHQTLYYTGQTATWNVDMTVTQVQGGQGGHLADLRFRTEANASGENGGLAFDIQRYRYEILAPVLTMNSCNVGSKSGGEERVIQMDNYGYIGKDTLEVKFGAQFVCDPSFTMSARIDSVWTTQSY